MPDVYQHPAALEILLLHRFSQAMPIFARGFAGADGQQPPGKTMKLRRAPGEARIGLTTALPQKLHVELSGMDLRRRRCYCSP